MAEQSLKNKTQKGLTWNLIEKFSTQGVQFIFGIILARLLSPDDYGIIAMPLIFLAIAQCLIDSGFSVALIRKPQIREEDYSTAFYFNIGVGIICYLILFLTSPLIANFYNTPILADILRVTALATLFNPLCSVQQAILTRKMDFKAQALVSFVGAILSGIVGLTMAYKGFGVWSLVTQQVGGYVIRTIFLWIIVKWRPMRVWSRESFGYLWGFGSRVLVQGIIGNIYDNIYSIVIGKVYNASDLGNYTRANTFAKLPSVDVTGVLNRVSLPVMSSLQNDNEKLGAVFSKMIRLAAFCMFPIMLGLSAVADPLIRILLTDKWEGCIILLQIMCFDLMWYPIHAFNLTILTAKGRSDITLKLEIIKRIIGITFLLITIPLGVVWMVAGGVASSLLCLFVNTIYTKKIVNIGFLKQMHDLGPILLSACVMWLGISCTIWALNNVYWQLLGGIVVGVAIYSLFVKIFMRENFILLIEMMPDIIKSKLKLRGK